MQPIYTLEPISAGTSEIRVPAEGRSNVGREATNEFSFPHDFQMSSVHFEIGTESGACRIRDLGSSNGLFLNTKRISTAIVVEGDEIQAGASQWRLVARRDEVFSSAPEPSNALSPMDNSPVAPPILRPPVWPVNDQHGPQGFASELLLTADDGTSRRLTGSQCLIIGRTAAAQWVFDDEQMSSGHMSLSQQSGVWKVTDLDSSNGTFVNESRVSEVQLFSGDELRGGKTRFEVALLSDTPKKSARLPTGLSAAADAVPLEAKLDQRGMYPVRPRAEDHAARQADASGNEQSSHASLRRLSDGQEFDLTANQIVSLGRSPESLISLSSDFEVSTQHATLLFDGSNVQLRDVGSSNGTFVGGKRVIATKLTHGDRLRVGKTEFVVCLPQTAGTGPSPAVKPFHDLAAAVVVAELPYYSDSDADNYSSPQVSANPNDHSGSGDIAPTGPVPTTGSMDSRVVSSAVESDVESDTEKRDTTESDTNERRDSDGNESDGNDTNESDSDESAATVVPTFEGLTRPNSEQGSEVASPLALDSERVTEGLAESGQEPSPAEQIFVKSADTAAATFPAIPMQDNVPPASHEASQIDSARRIDLDDKATYARQVEELNAIACNSGLFVYLGDAATMQPVDICLPLLRATSGWVLNGSEIENWIEAASQGLSGLPREWLNPSRADDASWMLPFLGNWGTGKSWLVLSHAELEDGLQSLRNLRQPSEGDQPLLASLTPIALAEFLTQQDSSLVAPFFAPFDAILMEVGAGERWALVGRSELEAILKSIDF